MKDELKRLVEDAEHSLTCDVAGCSRCFVNGRMPFNKIVALGELCAAVRELDKEREAERLTWVSYASVVYLWHAEPAKYRPLLDVVLKKLAEHGVPSHIIDAITPITLTPAPTEP